MTRSELSTGHDQNFPMLSVASIATFAFNYLQLGLIIYTIPHLPSNPEYCLLWLSFEAAILFDSIVRFGRVVFWSSLAPLSCLTFAITAETQSNSLGFLISLVAIFLISLSLKKVRTATGAKGKLKKWWRAAGYLASGLFNPWFLVVLVSSVALLAFRKPIISLRDSRVSGNFTSRNYAPAYAAILFHHLHYFSYAYIVIAVAHQKLGIPIHLLGIYFYVGWAGYYVFEHFRGRPKVKVVWGHIAAAGAVLAMGFAMQEFMLFSFLWFITGLGGGTIILMRDFITDADPDTYDAFKTWEAVGHVLGLAVVAVSILNEMDHLPFIVGASAGLACSWFTILSSTKSSGY